MKADPRRLAQRVVAGEVSALAQAITLAEDRGPGHEDLLRYLGEASGSSRRTVGVTGPPGVGKSTLVAALLEVAVARGHRVAVLAIDPSSPLSGGAFLGDRLRLGREFLAEAVFFRSLASRGAGGGISDALPRILQVVSAAPRELILVETVGIGQADVAVAELVDLLLLVLAPEQGDDVQLLKGGVVQVAELLVLNKVDLPGADRLRGHLTTLGLGPCLEVVAQEGRGVEALYEAILEALARAPGRKPQGLEVARRVGDEVRRTIADKLGRGPVSPALLVRLLEAVDRIIEEECR